MTLVTLDPEAWDALETLAAHTTDAHLLRRAQVLLWLAEGETVSEGAERLRITRQAVYKWVGHFQRRRTVHGVIDPLILAGIDHDPRELGYRSTVWTAPLLTQYLAEQHHIQVSRQSVSLAIARVGLRWQRPRHGLARRPATWRQAKGGSNAAWQGGSGRSS
jgi:transposase